MTAEDPLELSRCVSCQGLYLPGNGPCPRCGTAESLSVSVPPLGIVLAATELMYPASGWESPHRLALVEVAESVRLLGIVDGPVPVLGDAVGIRKAGGIYRISTVPGTDDPA